MGDQNQRTSSLKAAPSQCWRSAIDSLRYAILSFLSRQSRLSTRSSHFPSKTSKIDNLLLLRQWNNWRRVEIGILGGGKKKKNPTGRKSGHTTIPPRYRLIKHKREVLQERALSNEKPAPCQNAPRTYWALLKHNRRQGQANNVQCEHSTVLAGAQSITI